MKSERRKFRKVLIFAGVIFTTLAFVSVGCVSAESSFITNTRINDDDPQDWGSATCANFDYWMETFSIQAGDLKKVIIDKTFFQDDEVYPFNQTEIIYGLTLSGSIQLNGDTSLIRVILVDNDFNEYLVYEAYPLIVTNNSFSVTNVCEETCLLESITPYSLKIEVIDASIHIDELSYSDSFIRGIIDIADLQKQIKETQNAVKIKEINNQIKKKGLKWIAGETSVSRLFYEEKKKLFGRDKVPNLQGAEYYKGGILEIKSGNTSPSLSTDGGSSSLIESFDWRNRHGANNPDSPYYDGDPNGSGWITPVKSQGCAHCWAFTPLHATEAIVNLYFNQHLDLDLSEQDVASCSGGNIGCCQGGYIGTALNYIINTGVVDEACFPYSASCESCANKCSNPNEQINISGRLYPGYDEEDIKRAIIDYGPITGGIRSWWHFMVMIGFDKDPDDGETIWIFKNSWGTGWGDNGYGYLKVELTDLYGKNALLTPVTSLETPYEIACYDKDGDGYYNWGVSENKPSSCPEGCPAEKDCDDSDPCLGPFDSDGYCIVICPAPNITSYAPESPVNDTVGNWRTFNVTVNQTVNISWYLNDSLLFKNESIMEANYTLHAEIVGEHNVSVVASNANGTDMQTWIWNVTAPEPDLVVEKSVTIEDGNFTVNYKVTNIGGGPVGESTTCKFVNGTLMESQPCPALGPGENYSGSFDLEPCPCGETLNVTVCADNEKVVEESNETNNCEVNFEDCPPCMKPDLMITDIRIDVIKVGKKFNTTFIYYNITNNGDAEARRSVSNLTVDDNPTKKKDGVKPLAVGETRNEFFRYRGMPQSTIMVCADYNNKIEESNETNNCLDVEVADVT